MSVCDKFCGACSSRTYQQNFMKFYIQCYPNINSCLLTYHSTSGSEVTFFTGIFKINCSGFLEDIITQKFMYNVCIIRNNNDAICVHVVQQEALLFVFQKRQFYLGFYWMESYKILYSIYLYDMILISYDIGIIFAGLAY